MPVLVEAMAMKGKATYIGNEKENSQAQIGKEISKVALMQRARLEREGILKQNAPRQSEQHLPINTSVQPLRDSNIDVHVHEVMPVLVETMARKGKATYIGNQKENSQAQIGKEISKAALVQRARRERERVFKQNAPQQSEQHLPIDTSVQPLRVSNIDVHIHEVMLVLVEAMARKGKATYIGNEKENSRAQNGKEISKAALAQRARREWERILKQNATRQSEQHLPIDTSVQPL